MDDHWSVDSISDELYRQKLLGVPDAIANWLEPHGGLGGRDILDFGCGEATTALGIALRYKPRRIVAVEIHGEIDKCIPCAKTQLGLETLPNNLELKRIEADSSLDTLGSFDIVYSWSVFEHVSQNLLVDCLSKIKHVLRPNGFMFLQTTPLYYSAEGSHLKPWIPEPWAHLTMQQSLLQATLIANADSQEQADHLWWVYQTLNRVTAPSLLLAAEEAGFQIVREYRTYDDIRAPERLREIYTEDVLKTNQLVFLAKRPPI